MITLSFSFKIFLSTWNFKYFPQISKYTIAFLSKDWAEYIKFSIRFTYPNHKTLHCTILTSIPSFSPCTLQKSKCLRICELHFPPFSSYNFLYWATHQMVDIKVNDWYYLTLTLLCIWLSALFLFRNIYTYIYMSIICHKTTD